MLYSNTIFIMPDSKDAISTVNLTFYIGVVNFLSTFGGMYLLSKAGRKTILMATCGALGVFNLVIGYCYIAEYHSIMVISCLSMIAFFEFGSGPITWLYMAEIMQDKGSSIATVLNWLVSLAISYFIPQIGLDYIGQLFYAMGGVTILSVIFMLAFMKETRGKSPKQIEEMFYSGKKTKN